MTDSILDKVLAAKLSEEVQHVRANDALEALVSTLSQRDREVVVRRYGLFGSPEETLKEVGERFAITRERVRQVETHAVQTMRQMLSEASVAAVVEPVVHTTLHLLEEHGGLVSKQELWELVVQASGMPLDDQSARRSFEFFLGSLLSTQIDELKETREHVQGWKMHFSELSQWELTVKVAHEVLTTKGEPLEEDPFLVDLSSRLEQRDPVVCISHLRLSKQIRKNYFSCWGLARWNIVVPRRVNDKIYLVLKKAGSPLHFTEITKAINEAKFDHKVAYPSTVHNELILDKHYVLVGRGIYALREWGYTPGVVADVIAQVLEASHGSMDRERIVEEVLKRRFVRKSTILLALTDRKRFTRTSEGRYQLAVAQPTVTEPSIVADTPETPSTV